MSNKIQLELTPEEARNLLWLIHNTETLLDEMETLDEPLPNIMSGFSDCQISVLEALAAVTDFLERIFGKRKK